MAKTGDLTGQDAQATKISDIEKTPQGIVRRWLAELDIAARTEKDWRKEASEIIEIYEGEKQKQNSFNILWSNTDTLSPALYNSTPAPDVRRRFRDADPLGKAASTVIERELVFQLDQFPADREAKKAVLDMLLPGRAVLRVEYMPKTTDDRLIGQTVPWRHWKWDEFRRGPGDSWDEVPWVAFRHDFTWEMAASQFGEEMAEKLEYSQVEHSEQMGGDRETRQVFKTTSVWEIWDKEQRRVLFIAECYKEAPALEAEDPLHLTGFFPCPEPALAVEQSSSLIPIPLYRLYREQAKELDRVSARINKIVTALKVRGAYAGNLPELKTIIESDDNAMIPVQNVSEIATRGGLDNSIWIMPIDKLAMALQQLYLARTEIKQTIYEITGISDIVRGSSVASETATAQRLKNQWGSLRLQRMQREVQRLLRDCMRIQGELIAEHFTQEQLAATTNLQYPTMAEKQQAQQIAQQAAMMGQPPPPEVQSALVGPSWEDIMQLLRTDGMRSARIDIETDSTIADMVDRDMKGLAELTESLGQLVQGTGEAVMSGMLPVEAVKEIAMTITRRARMGQAVEDALDKIQAPQPQMQPEQMKQIEQGKKDLEGQQADIQKGRDEIAKGQLDMSSQQIKALESQLQLFQQERDQAVQVAQQAIQTTTEQQAATAAAQPVDTVLAQLTESQQAQSATVMQALQSNAETMQQVMLVMAQVVQALNTPKVVQFDRSAPGGRISGAVIAPSTLQ